MALQPAAKPTSLLGYYRLLSPTAGVRVSPLCLGAMNFGNAWEGFMGKCDKSMTFSMLDYFYENGGNFIDTANNYQSEESELWIGEWMTRNQNRDELVIATKFTTYYPNQTNPKIRTNFQGNHAKSLRLSLEASLKKLQTTYIDLLYLHWWDFTTSIPELMQALHPLVAAGKVLYLGISDTPAWVVSKANQYARDHGLTQFSVYQGHWSAALRDFERDIIPMCESEGMAIAPWGALGRGLFGTEAELAQKAANSEGRKGAGPTEKSRKISVALEKIAKTKGDNAVPVTSIALAYVMHKYPWVYPIVGGRKVEHLKANIEALSIELSDEELLAIDQAADFDVGFPMSILFKFGDAPKYRAGMSVKDIGLAKPGGSFDVVQRVRNPKPHQLE